MRDIWSAQFSKTVIFPVITSVASKRLVDTVIDRGH
jgi:hypothetical protein